MRGVFVLTPSRSGRDGDAGGKEQAAGALAWLAWNNTDNQAEIAETGAIPLLVSLLCDGDASGKKEAAVALGSLFLTTNAESPTGSTTNGTSRAAVAEALGLDPSASEEDADAAVERLMNR